MLTRSEQARETHHCANIANLEEAWWQGRNKFEGRATESRDERKWLSSGHCACGATAYAGALHTQLQNEQYSHTCIFKAVCVTLFSLGLDGRDCVAAFVGHVLLDTPNNELAVIESDKRKSRTSS